jgi:hypothetical protein
MTHSKRAQLKRAIAEAQAQAAEYKEKAEDREARGWVDIAAYYRRLEAITNAHKRELMLL